MTLREHLTAIGAPPEFVRWAADMTAERAWTGCSVSAWSVYWAARTPVNSPESVVRAAVDIAGQTTDNGGFNRELVRRIDAESDLQLQICGGPEEWEMAVAASREVWRPYAEVAHNAVHKANGPDFTANLRDKLRIPWRENWTT